MSSKDLYPEAAFYKIPVQKTSHKVIKKTLAVDSFDNKVTYLQPALTQHSYTGGFPGMYRNSLKQSRDSLL